MEPESAQLVIHSFCDDNEPAEHLSSFEPSEICDSFGSPEVQPRVGDDYQVEIPLLMTNTEYLQLASPTKPEIRNGNLQNFQIGLPIPIMWVTKEVENNRHELLGSVDSTNHVLKQEIESRKDGGKCLHAVPEVANNPWSENDEASYLLGLYIFEKDFCQVKRFVGNKKMVDILSHYYGNFYGSERYHRWSDCRKKRSKKCVYGRKIFSGLRQQELLYRMFPHVSDECRNTLVQISLSFGEGKIQLEEYVSSLKAAVGLNILVEAVGIGKGKQDLTGVASGSVKLNRIFLTRPKMPVGKRLSNLSTAEIINLLNGDSRLSKVRSSNLFWEAVWPCLLARGWESVLPEDHDHKTRLENSLVFLTPGIRKFSRKDLVRGVHYFDSLLDVLQKVAADPALIELVTEEDKCHGPNKENGWTNDSEVDLQDSPNRCYHDLKPRTSGENINAIKFEVVDASLAEEGAFKVRDSRTFPAEVMKNMTTREEDSANTSDYAGNESNTGDAMSLDKDQALTSLPTKTVAHRGGIATEKRSYNNASYRLSGPDSILGNAQSLEGQKLRQAVKRKVVWKAKPENRTQLPPVSRKRSRLPARNHRERNQSACMPLYDAMQKRTELNMGPDTSNSTERTLPIVDSPNKESSSTSTCKNESRPANDKESIKNNTDFHFGHSQGQPQPRLLIDLNLPPPVFENEEPSMLDLNQNPQYESGKYPDNSSTGNTTNVSMLSTSSCLTAKRRNRPPTVKALESLASGLLGKKQTRRSPDNFTFKTFPSSSI